MFTGTLLIAAQAVSVPPKPPPVAVAVCVIGDAPGRNGVRVNVTGAASEIFPARPEGGLSGASLIAAQRLIGPAVPLGEFTLTTTGLEADGVTTAFSFVTVSVEVPILVRIAGVEPVKTAFTA